MSNTIILLDSENHIYLETLDIQDCVSTDGGNVRFRVNKKRLHGGVQEGIRLCLLHHVRRVPGVPAVLPSADRTVQRQGQRGNVRTGCSGLPGDQLVLHAGILRHPVIIGISGVRPRIPQPLGQPDPAVRRHPAHGSVLRPYLRPLHGLVVLPAGGDPGDPVLRADAAPYVQKRIPADGDRAG